MVKRIRRTFSSEFKKNAVEMIIHGGKRLLEVSRELGIEATLLSKWKADYRQMSECEDSGLESAKSLAEENRRLKLELLKLKEERDILKKAVGFFSRET
jgi:transposase